MRTKPLIAFALLAACGTNETPQPLAPDELPTCIPNRDGAITADELPIALGATTAYYVGTNQPFDSLGTSGRWDLADERASDLVIALGPTALGTQWYANAFPAGEFVVDGGTDLDGIYHQDDQALWLDGIASREENPAGGQTLVVYASPLPALRFPVTDGQAYEVTAEIPSGIVAGLPFIGTDTLALDITGTGRLDLPYVNFSPTLRARTLVTRRPSVGTPAVARRTTLFLFECFGELARAESAINEPDPDFTAAVYLRRFALGVAP